MTQVLQHDYGKGKVTLLEIRAAIKAVKANRIATAGSATQSKPKVGRAAGTGKSRKGA